MVVSHALFCADDYTWSGELYLHRRPPPRLGAGIVSAGDQVFSFGGWENGQLVNRLDSFIAAWDQVGSVDMVEWVFTTSTDIHS